MSTTESPSTLDCLLCGGTQLYPGHRYRNHLVHEHGVIFGTDFIIEASIHKQSQLTLPKIEMTGNTLVRDSMDRSCQATSDVLCVKCSDKPLAIKEETYVDNVMLESSDPGNDSTSISLVDCWLCPLCPMVYKRRYHFDHHLTSSHQLHPEEVSSTWRLSLTEEQFNEKQHQAALASKVKKEPIDQGGSEFNSSGSKGDKSKWGPRAFSTMFLCKFCGEQFKRDSNLLVHLKLVHKDEPQEQIAEVLYQVSQYKLDGCVYQCKICGNKLNTSTSFIRHAREVHSLTLKQYNQEHGSAEILSGVFSCHLCNKNIKHTRNIITAHMKMVHQISWQEYQNRIQQNSNEEQETFSGFQEAMPPVVLFECLLCNSKVKLKKQHLDKAHHIDEDVYEAFLEEGQTRQESGQDGVHINGVAGAISCKICKKLCMDLSRHLKVSHKMMALEEYDIIPEFKEENFPCEDPTNLKCYFKCKDVFKKEVDLQVHLNLRHAGVDKEEFAKAKAAAVEEAALKSRSNLSIWCEICDSTLSGKSSFWTHITRKHQMTYQEYEAEFGEIDANSEPFQCKICSKFLKHNRNSINPHLKNIHSMSWAQYLAWVTEEKSGTVSISPTPVKMIQCKLCNSTVKRLKEHLKNTHSMTLKDYDEINKTGIIKEQLNAPSFAQEFSLSNSDPTQIDVRDKTLKSCNKCEFNFPTRKLFLEHCQVVHGMKFKLKTGESLPPPPVDRKSTCQYPEFKRIRLDNNDSFCN